MIELRDRRRVGDGRHDHRPSLITLAEVEHFHTRGRLVERAEVACDVGDVGEPADGTRDIAQDLQGTRDSCVGGRWSVSSVLKRGSVVSSRILAV